jgi:hypothetical protein
MMMQEKKHILVEAMNIKFKILIYKKNNLIIIIMNKIDLCKTIQTNVSKLTENEILELFKIIADTNANYTKNNNGIFLNLNWIDEDLLNKINNYILFCIKSQNEISKYELMKTLLNDSINTKENIVDIDTDSSSAVNTIDTVTNYNDVINDTISNGTSTIINQKQKFSSSMKFYLLKKKFMKQNNICSSCLDNDLTYEDYLIT